MVPGLVTTLPSCTGDVCPPMKQRVNTLISLPSISLSSPWPWSWSVFDYQPLSIIGPLECHSEFLICRPTLLHQFPSCLTLYPFWLFLELQSLIYAPISLPYWLNLSIPGSSLLNSRKRVLCDTFRPLCYSGLSSWSLGEPCVVLEIKSGWLQYLYYIFGSSPQLFNSKILFLPSHSHTFWPIFLAYSWACWFSCTQELLPPKNSSLKNNDCNFQAEI